MAEIIMGIDHGNGNMKGIHVNFPCGLVRYTSEPGRFMNEDILEYNGVYYIIFSNKNHIGFSEGIIFITGFSYIGIYKTAVISCTFCTSTTITSLDFYIISAVISIDS